MKVSALKELLEERKRASTTMMAEEVIGEKETERNINNIEDLIVHYCDLEYLFIQSGTVTLFKDGKLILYSLPHWNHENTSLEYSRKNLAKLMNAFSAKYPDIKIQQNGPTLLITW